MQMLMSGIAPIYISGFIEAEKSGYMDGLKAYQQKLNIMPLLEFIADALVSSKREEEASRTALKLLPESWAQRSKVRKGSSAERILSELLAHPVMSAEQASQILQVSLQAALTGLQRLEEDGILKVLTKTQRRKKWAAHEVLTILKRPFGQSPTEAIEEAR
jgi:Fic family protein